MESFADMSFFRATADVRAAQELYEVLNPTDASRVWDLYKTDYDAAIDGEQTAFGAFGPNPTKGDIVADYRSYIRTNIVRAYTKQFDRIEMVTMLNLLVRGLGGLENYIRIQLADGLSVLITDLLLGWNDTHTDDQPISYSGPTVGIV